MRYYCSICRRTITKGQFQYSKDKFGRALCSIHQKKFREKQKSIFQKIFGFRVEVRNKRKSERIKKKKITPEAKKLGKALERKGWKVDYEKWTGYKSVDIAITEARINIEVDGAHHHHNKNQALTDLKRDYHSLRKGFSTLRIPNSIVRDNKSFKETVDCIHTILTEKAKRRKPIS